MPTATPARRPSPRSRPMAMACTTWVATSGSGSQTGIATTTTRSWQVAEFRRTRRGQTTALILKSRKWRSASKKADLFFALTNTANVTCRVHEEKEILKPPRTTLVFDVSVRSDGMQANLRRANLRNGSPGSWPRQRLTNRRRFLKYLSAATRPSALRVGAC